jgi:hypothetical protein
MSFRAELTIEDKTYRVIQCSHTLSRNVHENGRPSSGPRFGRIDLEIESTDDIYFWLNFVGTYVTFNGSIIFKKRDEEVKMKELLFTQGVVVEHTERFMALGDSPMTIQLAISAETLIMETSTESAELRNNWSGS